jgi:hypothetical protein
MAKQSLEIALFFLQATADLGCGLLIIPRI